MTEKTLTDEEIFCLQGTRSYTQYYLLRKGFEQDLCSFCSVDRKLNHVLFENAFWMIWENPFPRKTLEIQLMIVSKSHIRFIKELSDEAWVAFSQTIQWIEKDDGVYSDRIEGGNLHVRFGDMRYNSGTIPHLHWNYWIPNRTGKVRIPVFKENFSTEENRIRMQRFNHQYTIGEVPE